MKILDLPLKATWYDMIESGVKTEEYREIKPYWSKRLLGLDAPLFSHRYGYQQCNEKGYTHVIDYNRDTIAQLAVEQADALIEELKKK